MSSRSASEFPPSGCHHCGILERLHFDRWTDEAGWHGFTEPSRELVAERMRAKYAARVAARTARSHPMLKEGDAR